MRKSKLMYFRPFTTGLIILILFPLSNMYPQAKIPDYSLTERREIPKEYTWSIEDIYRSNIEWEKDKLEVQKQIAEIRKYSADWTASASKMYNMLTMITDISKKLDKLGIYAVRQQHTDLGNSLYMNMSGDIQAIQVEFENKLSFVRSDVLKLGREKFNQYLKEDKRLEENKIRIDKILRLKDHVLSPDKEEIVSLTGLFSGAAEQASGILNDLEIPPAEVTLSDGKKVTLNFSNYTVYRTSKNPADRKLVMNTFWDNHRKFENTMAVLLDAEMKKQYFEAKTHNYSDCLESALYPNKIDTSVYYQLIRSVNANLEPLHKYIRLKRELLGLDKIHYEDIYVSSVKAVDKKYTFEEAKKLVFESLKPLGEEYLTTLKKAFDQRWIDIYPNKGKQSGAYSGGLYGVHPYIKLNYNGDYDAVSTLIHELGHAMHSYLSCTNQAYPNAFYVIFAAEVASTFNENLLMQYLLKNETDDLFKLSLIDNYLAGARATIYRQTLFAEFELAIHKKVESGGSLTPEWLDKLYLDLTRKYYGHEKGVMEVGDYIRNEWGNVPHFYMNYYVYQYSTGILASMALSNMVLSGGEKEREKYLTFLKAGGSKFPIDALKDAGVDMSGRQAVESGLKNFSNLVDQMEVLVQKLKQEAKL
ncbi:MAG: oligoendopeptidase F [Bacillota bacterium]